MLRFISEETRIGGIFVVGCFDLYYILVFYKLCFVNHHLYKGQPLISQALMSIIFREQAKDKVSANTFYLKLQTQVFLGNNYVLITL